MESEHNLREQHGTTVAPLPTEIGTRTGCNASQVASKYRDPEL